MTDPQTSRAGGNGPDPHRVARLEDETSVPIGQVVADAEADAQADFEGVERARHVTFHGERYRLAPKVGYMPLLKFAHYATKGGNTGDMQSMGAMYELLRGCFWRGEPCGKCDICVGMPDASPPVRPHPAGCMSRLDDDWPRFEEHAIEVNADDEDLFEIVQRVIEAATSRPTPPQSGSQRPAQPVSPRSRDGSRLPAEVPGLTRIDDLAR